MKKYFFGLTLVAAVLSATFACGKPGMVGDTIGRSVENPVSGAPPFVREFNIDEISDEIRAVTSPADSEDASSLLRAELLSAFQGLSSGGGRTVLVVQSYGFTRVDDLYYDQDANQLSWTYKNAGDFDLSGEVDAADIIPIAENYLANVENVGYLRWLDWDGSGTIGAPDVTGIALNYKNKVEGYRIFGASRRGGAFSRIADIPFAEASTSYPVAFEYDFDGDPPREVFVVPFDGLREHGTAGEIVDTGNKLPVAVLKVNRDSGAAPFEVKFNALESYDPDGAISRVKWYWMSAEPDARFDGINQVTRTFGYPGEYDVRIEVEDDEGAVSEATVLISVSGEIDLFETEPNNGPESANPLPPFPIEPGIVAGSLGSTPGYVGYAGDNEDWFSFTVPKQGYVEFYLWGKGKILSPSLEQIGFYKNHQVSPSGYLDAIVGANQPYYLLMYNQYPSWSYYLEYNLNGQFTPHFFNWEYDSYVLYDEPDAIGSSHLLHGFSAAEQNGIVHCTYNLKEEWEIPGIIGHSWNDGNVWQSEVIQNHNTFAGATSIALSSIGDPVVVFFRQDDSEGIIRLQIARRNTTGWSIEPINAPEPNQYVKPALALDSQDRARIVYADKARRFIHYLKETDEGFEIRKLIHSVSQPGSLHMALDGGDNAHLLYNLGYYGKVIYATYDGENVDFEIITENGSAGTIEIGDGGVPHIVFNEVYGPSDVRLMYAFLSDSEWVKDEVGFPSNVIEKCSLSLDRGIEIATSSARSIDSGSEFYRLRYATKQNGEWRSDLIATDIIGPPLLFELNGKTAVFHAGWPWGTKKSLLNFVWKS